MLLEDEKAVIYGAGAAGGGAVARAGATRRGVISRASSLHRD